MQITTPFEGVDERLEVTDHVSYALTFLYNISARELRVVMGLRLCVKP
jgi:hypothetical protein